MGGPRDLIGRVLNNTYRIDKLLGEGGMGAVYQAIHEQLDRPCAVKVLLPEVAANPAGLHRFKQEARIASGLGHQNAVRVIDFFHTLDGLHYLVMELLEGEDLAARLRREKRLRLSDALVILAQVASVLHAAHEQGIIHCDLKPQNIFLCRGEGNLDRIKLLDFGISKIVGKRITDATGPGVLGTPYYMAPEQVEQGTAAAVGRETDVYALGAILYEMLAGRPPFRADNVPALAYQIVHSWPPSLRGLRPDVPAEVADVIKKAMRKSRGRRYHTVSDLWREFSRAYVLHMTGDDDDTIDDARLRTVTWSEETGE